MAANLKLTLAFLKEEILLNLPFRVLLEPRVNLERKDTMVLMVKRENQVWAMQELKEMLDLQDRPVLQVQKETLDMDHQVSADNTSLQHRSKFFSLNFKKFLYKPFICSIFHSGPDGPPGPPGPAGYGAKGEPGIPGYGHAGPKGRNL